VTGGVMVSADGHMFGVFELGQLRQYDVPS
jgi:hypothetical protein